MFGLEITLINIKLTCRTWHIGRSSNNSEYVEQPGQSTERQVLAVSGPPGSRYRQRLGLGVSDGTRYFEVASEAQRTCLRMRNLEDE